MYNNYLVKTNILRYFGHTEREKDTIERIKKGWLLKVMLVKKR